MFLIAWAIVFIILWAAASGVIIYRGKRDRLGRRLCSHDIQDVFLIVFASGLIYAVLSLLIVLAWQFFLGLTLFTLVCILIAIAIKKGEEWHEKRKLAKDAETLIQNGAEQDDEDRDENEADRP